MNTRRILLIDDNPNDVELALNALVDGAGAQDVTEQIVSVAYSGAEGVSQLRRAQQAGVLPDVILLDLKMPHMDGLAVLDIIRTELGLRELPVVMLTTSGEDRDVRESYAHGASAYVIKPLDFGQFRDAMHTIRAFWTNLNRHPRLN